jgi:hypothetical protein
LIFSTTIKAFCFCIKCEDPKVGQANVFHFIFVLVFYPHKSIRLCISRTRWRSYRAFFVTSFNIYIYSFKNTINIVLTKIYEIIKFYELFIEYKTLFKSKVCLIYICQCTIHLFSTKCEKQKTNIRIFP